MDQDFKNKLSSAVFLGDFETVSQLINAHGLPSGSYDLLLTSVLGYINDCDEYGRTALHFTSFSEENQLQEIHNNEETNPDHVEEYRADNKRSDIAKLLLSQGAKVDAQTKDGVTCLHVASSYGLEKVVQTLLEYNANVNVREKRSYIPYAVEERGNMPLHYAVIKGHTVICRMLINKGADIDAKAEYGLTALMSAVEKGHKEIIKLLLEHNASVDSESDNRKKPLHFIPSGNCKDIIEDLLKHGAEINYKDKFDKTALYFASSVESIEALLENGADINLSNGKYSTAPLLYFPDIRNSLESGDVGGNESDSDDEYSSDDENTPDRVIIRRFFKNYIVKMKVANLYVSDINLQIIRHYKSDKIAEFEIECEKEVTLMKNEKVSKSNCTFYDIIVSDLNTLARFMSNDDIVSVLQSIDLKIKFPIYGCILKCKFRKGMERKKLIEAGFDFYVLYVNSTISVELPTDCIEKILGYLTNNDLKILANLLKV